jgi:hypothetical protein
LDIRQQQLRVASADHLPAEQNYVLMQFDPENGYVLHSVNNIKPGHYLGQQVKVTGTRSD